MDAETIRRRSNNEAFLDGLNSIVRKLVYTIFKIKKGSVIYYINNPQVLYVVEEVVHSCGSYGGVLIKAHRILKKTKRPSSKYTYMHIYSLLNLQVKQD